jgi:hypothetical protein
MRILLRDWRCIDSGGSTPAMQILVRRGRPERSEGPALPGIETSDAGTDELQ